VHDSWTVQDTSSRRRPHEGHGSTGAHAPSASCSRQNLDQLGCWPQGAQQLTVATARATIALVGPGHGVCHWHLMHSCRPIIRHAMTTRIHAAALSRAGSVHAADCKRSLQVQQTVAVKPIANMVCMAVRTAGIAYQCTCCFCAATARALPAPSWCLGVPSTGCHRKLLKLPLALPVQPLVAGSSALLSVQLHTGIRQCTCSALAVEQPQAPVGLEAAQQRQGKMP